MMQMMTRTAIHPLKIVAALGATMLVWGLVLAYLSGPAWAADITVNTTADEQNTNNGCSLREAIINANSDNQSGSSDCAAGTGNDVINFALPGDSPWTVNLTAKLPPLTSNIEIAGPGDDRLTVTRPDTAKKFRIFTVTGDTTVVTISGITISNGKVVDTEGGGILIADSATLTVTGSTISGNTTEDGGGGIGIDSDIMGTLTVTDSTITGNRAKFDNGGGIRNDGNGTVEVTNSTISHNFSGHEGGAIANDGDGTMTVTGSTMGPKNHSDSEGGGIYNSRGTLAVTGSTIRGNTTDSDGGGIYNGGTLTVTDSTVSGNTSGPSFFGGEGGGIYSSNDLPDTDPTNDPDDTTTITNSTISGNTAAGEPGIGGGVYNSFGLTIIKNSTITNNTAPDGRGSGVASRGFEEFASAETEVLSSIISANTNTDVDFLTDADFFTPTNTFLSRGYNLIGDGNAIGDDDPNTDDNAFDQTGDTTGVSDPKLGDLANKGGPTRTHALLTGSPAIDAGPPTSGDTICPPPAEDQRGVSRPQGDRCDIGAFELEQNTAPTAANDAYSTNEDTTLKVPAAQGVLANDTDTDSDTLSAVKVTDPSHGQLTLNPNGSFTYTPDANFEGSDSFTYKTSDGTEVSNTATVNITVKAVNDTPSIALAAGGSCVDAGGTINLTLGDVETAEGSLTLSATSSNRTLVPEANILFSGGDQMRTMTVRPAEGQSGTANITITLSDGSLKSTKVVSVKVGTHGVDAINGTTRADMLFGLDGVDAINGLGSNDLLCGGKGVDTLNANSGDDTLGGGLGSDRFSGGTGTDTATDFSPSQGDTKDNTLETF